MMMGSRFTGRGKTGAQAQRSGAFAAVRPHTLRRIFIVACLASSLGLTIKAADPTDPTGKRPPVVSSNAETVIAAYLVNFLRYVEWPETVPPAGEPWRIGLLKSEELHGPLDRLTQGKIVRGRPITVVNASDPAALRDCQMVLLAEGVPANSPADAKVFAGRPVLTVVYHEKASAVNVAMIELILQGRNIRYRLNAALLTAEGLKPTPGLLENSLPPAAPSVAQLP